MFIRIIDTRGLEISEESEIIKHQTRGKRIYVPYAIEHTSYKVTDEEIPARIKEVKREAKKKNIREMNCLFILVQNYGISLYAKEF